MTATVFVDTNILIYSRDASEPEKQPRAEAWRRALWERRAGRLSTQVLNEFYQVVTRKLTPGMPVARARAEVSALFHWEPVSLTPEVTRAAWHFEDRFQLSYWDALIVAAAHVADCEHLLSEDFQDGQDFDGLRVVNPFRVAPEELLR